MRKANIIVAALAISLTSMSAQAQVAPGLSGIVFSASQFTPMDIMNYSQNSGAFNTARSSAMGGAFTSLGADLASININPAGLGMYRSSAWGFSPSISVAGMSNDYKAMDNSKTNFSMNNIGAVFNTNQRSSGVVSFSLGFSYNKAADFNYRTGFELPEGFWSVNDIFAMQLNGLGRYMDGDGWINHSESDVSNPFANSSSISPWEWGAVLANRTGGVSDVKDAANPNNTLYRVNSIGGDDRYVTPSMQYNSRGSIGEYNFSGGMNINNILYIGFGFTIQDIYQRQHIGYTETYAYSQNGPSPSATDLKYMNYDQYTTISGVGINAKLGLTVRPIPSLRIGLAVHSPSIVNLNQEYYASMDAGAHGPLSGGRRSTNRNLWEYDFVTPTRLLAGVSYTFGNIGIIAADYERIYYNGMRLTSEGYWVRQDYKDAIKADYRPTNNFKAGLEIKPIQSMAIRGGYSFYDSPLRSNDAIVDRLTTTRSQNISAGLGFRFGRYMNFDLAYIYSLNDYAGLETFYYQGEERLVDANGSSTYIMHAFTGGDEPPIMAESEVSGLRMTRHTVTASFTFLF